MPPTMKRKLKRPLTPYYHRLRNFKIPFKCPHCDLTLLPHKFEGHCKQHGLDSETQCVWCHGRTSWEKKTKFKNINHLLNCFAIFVIPLKKSRVRKPLLKKHPLKKPPVQEELPPDGFEMPVYDIETFTLFDLTPACPDKDFFGRLELPGMHPMAYRSVFEPPAEWWDEPEALTFQSDALNLAATCVRKYLRGGSEWFHLQIHAVAFNAFHQAMEADGGITVLLPFWCWCDGGPQKEARHRQHRHVIAISPIGHFKKNVWKKIKIPKEDRPCQNFSCIHSNRIESPLHLINTIGYVSNQKSECKVSADVKTDSNHFCINVTLPEKFKWVVSGLWEEGIMQLIVQECGRLGADKLAPFASCINGSWKIYVKHFPKIPKDLVLPVSKHFFPTIGPTDYFLHLTKDRKLYFEKREQNEKDWGRVQAESGNIFCKVIENELITPAYSQQKYFRMVEPLMYQLGELEKEIEVLKSELDTLKEEKRKRKADEENQSKKPRLEENVDIIVAHLLNELVETVAKNVNVPSLIG